MTMVCYGDPRYRDDSVLTIIFADLCKYGLEMLLEWDVVELIVAIAAVDHHGANVVDDGAEVDGAAAVDPDVG